VLKSALGGNSEYFHSQTLGDSDRLKAGETGDFIQQRRRLSALPELYTILDKYEVALIGSGRFDKSI
jgi:hypothetical protein